MATTFFLTSGDAPPTSTFTTALTKRLSLVRGAAAVSNTDATVASLVAAANPQGSGTVAPLDRAAGVTLGAAGTVESNATIGASSFWVTDPLSAVTVSGSITVNLRAAESQAQANYGIGCKVYRVSAANAVTTAFAQGSNTVELGTSEAAKSITLTPTSTALATGERLAILVFFVGVGSSAAGRTATVWYDGPTGGASGDSFLTFTETIVNAPGVAYRHETPWLGAVNKAAVW